MRRVMMLLASLAVLGAACGGDGSEADAELAEALTEVWEADDPLPGDVETSCLAEGFVEGIGGAEGAEEYGVTADDISDDTTFDDNPLSADDALAAASKMLECDGADQSLASAMLGSEDEELIGCYVEEMPSDLLTASMAQAFVGDSEELDERFENEFETALDDAISVCGEPA